MYQPDRARMALIQTPGAKTILSPELRQHLPSSLELPDSDGMPVRNVDVSLSRSEDQNFLPNLLLFLLEYLWEERDDWYFGVDMGIYHTTGVNPKISVVPDAFLSLGVERRKGGKSRRSYVTWEEDDIVPALAIEMVSHTPGGEYDEKLEIYRKLGVIYYVIYNPEFWKRDGHLPFEVYQLVNGVYRLQIGEPFWMPEVGLGIGRCQMPNDRLEREILTWYDRQGQRHLSGAEVERSRADKAQLRADRLAQRLRELGQDV
jgi:Uma2 family endonuclease